MLKELREKRSRAIAQAQDVMNVVQSEKRDMSAEEAARFDALMADVENLKTQIARLESLDAATQDQNNSRGRRTVDEVRSGFTARNDELRSYLLGQTANPLGFNMELRAQTSLVGASGGFTVKDEAGGALDIALKAFGGMRNVANVIRTQTGADYPMALMDDTNTANAAAIVTENTNFGTGPDLTFTNLIFKSYKIKSGVILLPIELIQDSSTDIGAVVGAALGERLGRAANSFYTNGTGVSQPEGIVPNAVVGVTGATLGSVTYDELVSIIHSVDAAYRTGAGWMFSDATLAVIRKLKDGNGRPLFWSDAASLASGVEGTILGYPYQINNDMPSLGTVDAKSILFGNFKRGYTIRDVLDVQILNSGNVYFASGQVGFAGFLRTDGRITDAGTHPVKAFKNAAA